MPKKKTLMLSVLLAASVVALPLGSEAGERKRKKTETTEEKPEKSQYDSLMEKSRTSTGMFRLLAAENDYYFEIPDSLLGRDFLVVNKVSGVPGALNDAGLNKGMEYDNKLVRFYRDDKVGKMWVTTYDPRVSVPEEDAIARSVKDNYREAIIEYFPIEAYNADSTAVVIQVNKVFDGSSKSFNDVYNSIALSMASFKSDLSKIKSVKMFPENAVVKAYMTASVMDGGTDVPLTVETTTNIVLLPKEPMVPRFADSRVGFFSSPHVYFNDEQQQVGGVMQGELGRKFYLSVTGSPITAGHSVHSVAPSYLYEVATGDYWKVTNVSEDFHNVGWALVFAALQKKPPESVVLALEQSGLVGPAGPCSAQSSLLSGKDYELY